MSCPFFSNNNNNNNNNDAGNARHLVRLILNFSFNCFKVQLLLGFSSK